MQNNQEIKEQAYLYAVLAQNMECLFTSERYADVKFKIGDQSFMAHKGVLALRSPALETVLSNFRETRKNSGFINISGTNFDTFKVFVKYLYTYKISERDITPELLEVATKYKEESLKKKCEKFLSTCIDKTNAIRMLIFAVRNKNDNLVESSAEFIAKNFEDLVVRREFDLVYGKKDAASSVLKALAKIRKIKN